MLKKKLFGIFGKKDKKEEKSPELPQADQPVISTEQISSLENLSDETASFDENPEDIISKLSQINSIIGQEDEEPENEFDEMFSENQATEEPQFEEQLQPTKAVKPSADSIFVDPLIILSCIPEKMLAEPMETIRSKYGSNENFNCNFDKSELLFGLSVGKLEFKIGTLADKFSANLFREEISSVYEKIVELPLMEIIPKVPPSWFANPEQDHSREEMVLEMEDLFEPLPTPEPEVLEEQLETGPEFDRTAREMEVEPPQPVQSNEESPGIEVAEEAQESQDYSEPEEEVYQSPELPEAIEPPQASFDDEEDEVQAIQNDIPPKPEVQEPARLATAPDSQVREEPVVEEVYESPTQSEPIYESSEDEIGLSSPTQIVNHHQPSAPPSVDPHNIENREIPQEFENEIAPTEAATPNSAIEYREKAPVEREIEKVREIAKEFFEVEGSKNRGTEVRETPISDPAFSQDKSPPVNWKSQAPNGIDINRAGVEELTLLNGVGEHLAQVIIRHRKENGLFRQLQDLRNVPGLGPQTYRTMTKLGLQADLKIAESNINKNFGILSKNISLNEIVRISTEQLDLDAMFISSLDGLILAKCSTDERIMSMADSLAASGPQLYKRSKKTLRQGQLPIAEMFVFYFDKRAVTFSGAGELFVAYIHKGSYPNQKQLRNCRKITSDLVWYCSHRAVLS